MDITNRIIRITRRMTEIEELKANGDLPQLIEEELSDEYEMLDAEYEKLRPVGG